MPLLGATGGGSAKGFGALANLGYFIRNSLRFRRSASAYLNRTFSTPTNNKIWTYSAWIKRGALGTGTGQTLMGYGVSGTLDNIGFNSSEQLVYFSVDSGGATQRANYNTTAVFRDPSAWYHIIVAVDTTQATAGNRFKLYVNGVQQTVTTTTSLALNWNTYINSALSHGIGWQFDGTTNYFDGYMAEVNFVDGQQLTPSSFGKTDAATGQWIPKKYAGTYGTNGFYLKFADASAATAAAIGKDSSGNGNNWTPNNISVTSGVTYDAMIDSPTLSGAASNYAVMNPLNTYSSITIDNANLRLTLTEAAYRKAVATMAFPTTGTYYCEANLTGIDYVAYGIVTPEAPLNNRVGETATGYGAVTGTTQWDRWNNGTASGNFWNITTTNPTLQIAIDTTNGKLWLGYNNTWLDSSGGVTGNPSTGANATFTIDTARIYLPSFGGYKSDSIVINTNFGQRPFSYTPPTGYKALNTFNLP